MLTMARERAIRLESANNSLRTVNRRYVIVFQRFQNTIVVEIDSSIPIKLYVSAMFLFSLRLRKSYGTHYTQWR